MFIRYGLPKPIPVFKPIYVEQVNANDFSSLSSEKIILGNRLIDAFHNKQNPNIIRELVNQGAPVNIRLDYGLEVKYESDFVAQFFLLLEGDQGNDQFLENAIKLMGDQEKALQLVNYVKTGLEIFNILYSENANNEPVNINPKFLKMIENNSVSCRGNPMHANGSLIMAAGLRDKDLVKKMINKGKLNTIFAEKNGAAVNFRGHFGDNAAVWSSILLDKNILEILLNHDSDIHEIGITNSSLLHWVAVADRLDNTQERHSKAMEMANLLLLRGAKPNVMNIIGKTPIDYAQGELKELFELHRKMKYAF